MVFRRRILTLGLATLGLALACAAAPPTQPPTSPPTSPSPVPPPPAPKLSGNVPLDVFLPANLPPTTTPAQVRPFFDTFSWQSFVALSWPSDPKAIRGTPLDPNDPKVFLAAKAGAHPVVWHTYREDTDLFDVCEARPPAWNSKAPAPTCPDTPACPNAPPGMQVFARYTKGDDVVAITNEAFSYPLIDQNRNYAVFEVRFNQAQYDFVRGPDADPKKWLYLVRNLAAAEPLQMPASSPPGTQGALMVKAGWKQLDPATDDASRFFAIDAMIYDPDSDPDDPTGQQTPVCYPAKVGLIGIHIVQKLKTFPEWIWSTFEQVDNVPENDMATTHAWSFNNGKGTPKTIGGWENRPINQAPLLQAKDKRVPAQVTRFNPIPDDTQKVNAAWQQAMGDTVWRNYRLVITQWPSNPTPQGFKLMEDGGIYPQDCGAAFPPDGAVNPVMETFFQSNQDAMGSGGNSCMSCHYRAALADFSWSLMRGAH